MPLNSSSDNKSFETVELLPIQELFTDISEPASIAETSDIKMPSVEIQTQVPQTPIYTDSVLEVSDVGAFSTKDNDNNAAAALNGETAKAFEPPKIPDTEKTSDKWAAIRAHSNANTIDNTYNDNYITLDNSPNTLDYNKSTSNTQAPPPPPPINYDFNRFFRGHLEAEKERQQDRKSKLFAFWFVIITCIILFVVISTILKLYARIDQNREQYRIAVENYPDSDNREYTDFDSEGLITSANPDYQILFLENIKYANQPCAINPELIIHVGEDKRTLYFRIMPQEDNIVPRITVTAYDINGNQIAENIQSLYGVGAYDIGILPITLNIPADAIGVGYTVKCNGGTMATPDTQRVIHDIRAEDDHIYVSVYGKYNLENRVYVILYKDGELVDIVSAIPGGTYTGQYREAETDFDVSQIDFDNFEVYI